MDNSLGISFAAFGRLYMKCSQILKEPLDSEDKFKACQILLCFNGENNSAFAYRQQANKNKLTTLEKEIRFA